MIRITCPSCGQDATFEDAVAGLSMPCPHCQVRVKVAELPSGDAWKILQDAARAAAGPGAPAPELVWVPAQPRPFSPLRWILGGIALLLAVAGVSWLLAGNTIWKYILIFAAVLPGACAVGYVWGHVRTAFRQVSRAELPLVACLLYIALVVGSGFFIDHQFARSTVYIDNFSRQSVALELDGRKWLDIAQGRTTQAILRRGTYELVVKDLREGKVVDRLTLNVDDAGYYVLNVLGAQVYATGVAQYGGFAFGPGPEEKAVQDRWFRADQYYLFQEPPQTITVSTRRGQAASADRSYIRRGPPKKTERRP